MRGVAPADTTLRCTDLSRTYCRREVLCIDDLVIKPGERIVVVGPNGAGKTTWLRLLLDLVRPTGGTTTFGLLSPQQARRQGLLSGYLGEDFLIPYLTVDEYLAFVGRSFGLETVEIATARQELDEFIGFDGSAKLIRQLSTGMGQKVGLAGALLANSPILVLDEPFANLDPPSCLSLIRQLQTRHASTNATHIVSSHSLEYVADIADRVLLLEQGHIIWDETEYTQASLRRHFSQDAWRC